MDKIETTFFKNLLTNSEVSDIIDVEKLTVFVPSNEAIQEYTTELEISVSN